MRGSLVHFRENFVGEPFFTGWKKLTLLETNVLVESFSQRNRAVRVTNPSERNQAAQIRVVFCKTVTKCGQTCLAKRRQKPLVLDEKMRFQFNIETVAQLVWVDVRKWPLFFKQRPCKNECLVVIGRQTLQTRVSFHGPKLKHSWQDHKMR